jgi:threonine dehydrogenase-like Zn-dependent dehydrogenase
MKAIAVYPKLQTVRLIDRPEPQIGKTGSVKVRILEVGICGTDKEILRFEYGEAPPGSEYFVLGHESLGEVVEVESSIEELRAGDLVVAMVRRPCPVPGCSACRAGRQDFCYTGKFTERGIKGLDGFLQEYIVDRPRYLVPVPGELRDVAVLTEPLSIAEKAFEQMVDIQERLPWLSPAVGSEPPLTGRRGVVLGAGPIGLLGAMKMVASGCETAVYSREAEDSPRANLVRSFGARYVSSAGTTLEDLADCLCTIDMVYEATGASKLAFDALGVLGPNAIFVFTGVPGRQYPIELDAGTLTTNIVLKNQIVLGTVNAGRQAFDAAIRDLRIFKERFPDALRAMITARHPLEHFPELDLGNLGGIKNVITV